MVCLRTNRNIWSPCLAWGTKKLINIENFSPRALLVLAHVMKRITMVTSKSVRMADSVANSFHFHANPTPAEPKNKKFKIHFSNLPIIIYDFFFGRREPPLLYYHVVYPYINPPPHIIYLYIYLPFVQFRRCRWPVSHFRRQRLTSWHYAQR